VIDDVEHRALVDRLRVRCSCRAETVVVWDKGELDYLPLGLGWRWSSGDLFTCGAPGHRQASSEPILTERRNGFAAV
jgi:hypothetical protein